MRKKLWLIILIVTVSCGNILAKDFIISTANTSLVVKAEVGKKPLLQYYGTRIEADKIQEIYNTGMALNADTYPVFGIHSNGEKAMAVMHSGGNMSLDLAVDNVTQCTTDEAEIVEIVLKDKVYPFVLKQFYKAYKGTDVISTWVEVTNNAKKRLQCIVLLRSICRYSGQKTG